MNNINLSNAIEALKHALKAHEMAERSIGLAMNQIRVADTEAVDPAVAVEIHDNTEYQRGQKDGLTIARHFIRNWLRENQTATSSTARYLAGDFDQEFFPETILSSGMKQDPVGLDGNSEKLTTEEVARLREITDSLLAHKRFPWEITQAGL